MLERIESSLEVLVSYVWGLPLVCLLLGAGVFFTVWNGFPQLRFFRHAIDAIRGRYDDPSHPGEINHFRALCAALSATVGLGNIAGVAIAIKMGGPGATFWMIVAGFLGMASKYTECTLSQMFRRVDDRGVVHGGPMYTIESGLGPRFRPLAMMFAVCCILGALGGANLLQANQVAAALKDSYHVAPWITGVILAFLTAVVIIGGIKRIGVVAGWLVPVMALSYIAAGLFVLAVHADQIPTMLWEIISGAFSGTAAVGGFTGAAFKQVLVQGIRRAVFSNEAGLGSAAIAHSAAKTDEPVREGVVALLEPFVDTVVICTMTALVIDVTHVWKNDATGVVLTIQALNAGAPGLGTYFIPIAVFLFAYSTLISWSYYGERSVDYLFGEKAVLPYKIVFCGFAFIGAIWTLDPVIAFADSAFGLMVIPNMISLILLAPVIRKATRAYDHKLRSGQFHAKW